MESSGLSYLEWDEGDEDMVEGVLEECTIVHRKLTKDRLVRYKIMDANKTSLEVILEGVADDQSDPLKGIHACRLQLDVSRSRIQAFCRGNQVFFKR